MNDVIRPSNEHSPECKSDTLKKRRATMPELQDHVREAAPDLLRELRDIVGRYERALTEAGWSDSRVKLATFSAREAIAKAGDDVLKAPAVETVEYRKWPGEPPHCMSCDCGMTDQQKRTVPFDDYQTFHTALMGIVYESKSFTEAVKLASDALQRKPTSEKAGEQT